MNCNNTRLRIGVWVVNAVGAVGVYEKTRVSEGGRRCPAVGVREKTRLSEAQPWHPDRRWRPDRTWPRDRPWHLVLLAMAILICTVGCDGGEGRTKLRVFVADSLARPFKALGAAFEAERGDVEIVQIASGSVLAARKLTDGNDRADVLAVADYRVIDDLLRPAYADWSVCFATNEIVIAYTDMSVGAADLREDNWFEVLTRPEVKVQAANPYHDPCGYWTQLSWRLADLKYAAAGGGTVVDRLSAKCGPARDRRSDSQELLRLVESAGGIDYVFVYLSQARQHNLAHLRLGPKINMGSAEHVEHYRQAVIELTRRGGEAPIVKRGDAIVFAVTIPKTAAPAELAADYVAFLLSAEGKAILRKHHVAVVDQPWTFDSEGVPAALNAYIVKRDRH